MPKTRDPALRPYRVAVYVVYGAICLFIFVQLLRSVIGDLYGARPPSGPRQSPMACLEDVEQLYDQLSARAVQPAPAGLESDQLSREWDTWSRRWEQSLASVSERCGLDDPSSPVQQKLASALDGVEELRRRLSRSGEEAASEARQVRNSLDEARALIAAKPASR